MFTQYDPDDTESNAYDDRDTDFPEFEIDEELVFGGDYSDQDPAML